MEPGERAWWADFLGALGVAPDVADDWAPVFAHVMPDAQWRGELDLPNFLAQNLHESALLTRLEENLSYSAARLTQVWPGRFPTPASAQPYARNPRALANKVYGGRLGNVDPDDGWRYRGRGLIQITGRDNYALTQALTGYPLLQCPDLLLEPEPALRSSLAWWLEMIPQEALADVARVTRIVNGGANGLAERRLLTELALTEWLNVA
jgi:putative chitinase